MRGEERRRRTETMQEAYSLSYWCSAVTSGSLLSDPSLLPGPRDRLLKKFEQQQEVVEEEKGGKQIR